MTTRTFDPLLSVIAPAAESVIGGMIFNADLARNSTSLGGFDAKIEKMARSDENHLEAAGISSSFVFTVAGERL